MEKLVAVSVDLDELDCYLQIHGLATNPDFDAKDAQRHQPVYDLAVERFANFFVDQGIQATFFVIGRSLERERNRAAVGRLYDAGFEIANHTYAHRYDFTRQSLEGIRRDIRAASTAIADVTGQEPVGFRAPGYTMTDNVIEILREERFLYDSSVFPCPLYFGAKASAIGWHRLRGRKSASLVDTPAVLSAPAQPYRTGAHYWQRGEGLLELPIGVTSGTTGRLPYIGTSLHLAGPRGAAWLTKQMSEFTFVNLELHGMDLLSTEDPGVSMLEGYQPDVRHSLSRKLQTLTASIRVLRDKGFHFVTLAQAAAVYA